MRMPVQLPWKIPAALPLAFALLFGVGSRAADAQISVQFRYGSPGHPLQGHRYETMRALAHYLDERAQSALQAATATGSRGWRTRRFLSDISEFARRADHFHERMDNYQESAYDVPNEVLALERRARAVSIGIRDARVFRQTYDDWDAVLDVLNRMKQSLAGYDVQVPPAHRPGGGDYDRDYAPFRERPDYRGDDRRGEPQGGPDVFSGSGPGELRRLADRLDDLTAQASSMAGQGMGGQYLRHFNEDTRALRQRSDAGQMDRNQMADAVNHLLEDARQISGRFDSAQASPDLQSQWGRVVDTLNRMSQLLQR